MGMFPADCPFSRFSLSAVTYLIFSLVFKCQEEQMNSSLFVLHFSLSLGTSSRS